ncbi:acylneuraminate cytidylyltransferase family protein [Endothiovibrio diazotrophicus]
MAERYAVICARGGSSRVPRKNILPIGGKPLIAHTIEAAKASGLFGHVVVNSEDDEILVAAEASGAELYRRPQALASGTTFMIQVVQEMIDSLGMADDDVVSILFPTCPLRNAEDIRGAYRLFVDHGATTPVAAVTEYEYPIQVALSIDGGGRLAPMFGDDYRKSTRHNDHAKAYRANYSVMFNTAGMLRRQGNLIGDAPIPFVMPFERSIDIDHPFQMEMARLLIEHGER